ncbi:MAG: hypothetical protein MZV70_18080 [Desulfobacterales bacterium]|nr:hypothetical protein [Desulfobacterales bacterium]
MLAFMNAGGLGGDPGDRPGDLLTAAAASRLWVKGETSGNVQLVQEIRIDCDDDAVVLKIEQVGGAACHTGHRSCFHKMVEDGAVQHHRRSRSSTRRRFTRSEPETETGHPQGQPSGGDDRPVQALGLEHQRQQPQLFP